LSASIVKQYLNTLFFDPKFPAPWTDIDVRENNPRCRKYRPVVGFKIMYNTLDLYPFLTKWLFENRLHVIHLRRFNLLRSYVSSVRMGTTRIAHYKDTVNKFAKQPVFIDVDEFIKYADEREIYASKYHSMFRDNRQYIELFYEDVFQNLDVSKKNIMDFLRVGYEDMPNPEMKKIGSANLRNDIENWEEVYTRLSDCRYSVYLK